MNRAAKSRFFVYNRSVNGYILKYAWGMIGVLRNECAICHRNNVGFFNEKLILKDRRRICKDCARRLFTKPKSFGAVEWASQHTISQVRRLLASRQKVDVKEWRRAAKEERASQTSLYQSIRQQYVYEGATRLGQCYFNPERHMILFPPIHGHTYKTIDEDFIIGYTPVEIGLGAQHRAQHDGFSSSGHGYKLLTRLAVVITLRNGANYQINFIKGRTKQGYTTDHAYQEFRESQAILAAIVRKNNRLTGSAPLDVSSI